MIHCQRQQLGESTQRLSLLPMPHPATWCVPPGWSAFHRSESEFHQMKQGRAGIGEINLL
jgi:hypothetical protein